MPHLETPMDNNHHLENEMISKVAVVHGAIATFEFGHSLPKESNIDLANNLSSCFHHHW